MKKRAIASSPPNRKTAAPRRRPSACVFVSSQLLFLWVSSVQLSGAQTPPLESPPGASATQIGGTHFDVVAGWVGGAWIEVSYGRPILRGRDVFGPADHVEALNDGAEVWRAGANQTTQLRTELELVIGGETLQPNTYTLFVELATTPWTLIVSRWPAQERYEYENSQALFGAYGYTSDRDVTRVPMTVEELPRSFDQLSWQFLDVTETGGRIALLWDRKLASVPFQVSQNE